MARPRRETKQLFYDTFADFEVADQAIVLDMLGEIHRQKKRLARAVPTKTDAVASAARDPNECPNCVGRGWLMLPTIVDGKDRMTCPVCNGVGNKKNLQGSLLDDAVK